MAVELCLVEQLPATHCAWQLKMHEVVNKGIWVRFQRSSEGIWKEKPRLAHELTYIKLHGQDLSKRVLRATECLYVSDSMLFSLRQMEPQLCV